MQLIIVVIILAIAILYTAFRLYKTLTDKSAKCSGCPLKEACDKEKKHKS